MAANVEGEKTFHNYEQLMPHLRSLIINKMEPEERCRTSGCSKMSQTETVASKNYIHAVHFYSFEDTEFEIYVIFAPYGKNVESARRGFQLKFEEEGNPVNRTTIMKYAPLKSETRRPIWSIELPRVTNNPRRLPEVAFHALAEFTKRMQLYQNTIQRFTIDGQFFNPVLREKFHLAVTSLRRVDDLMVGGHFFTRDILEKTRRPLKKLRESGDCGCDVLASCEKVYDVEDLYLSKTKLNNEQLQKLSASRIEIPIGDLTEQNIYDFIKSWQNGSIDREIEVYRWRLVPEFDTKKLLKHLQADWHDLRRPLNIRHEKIRGRNAILDIDIHGRLRFFGVAEVYQELIRDRQRQN